MILFNGNVCTLTPITTSKTNTKYKVQDIEKTPMYVVHPLVGVTSTKVLRFLLIHSTKGLQNCSSKYCNIKISYRESAKSCKLALSQGHLKKTAINITSKLPTYQI